MTMYRPAEDARQIGNDLIETLPVHESLGAVRIEYLFRDKAATSAGRQVWGKARKISGLNAYLGALAVGDSDAHLAEPTPFFVIELALDVWETLTLTQRIALLDHELSHCHADWSDETGEQVLSTVGHDVEEFIGVAQRNGAWRGDLAHLGDVLAITEKGLVAV